MDTKEAKKIIEQEKKERTESCQREILEVLNKYNCVIDPIVNLRISSMGIKPEIQLVIIMKEG